MTKNRVMERMIKIQTNNFFIRVWRIIDESNLNPDNTDIIDLINSYSAAPNDSINMNNILCSIEKLPNIAAVEVLDKHGNGLLLYPDWN